MLLLTRLRSPQEATAAAMPPPEQPKTVLSAEEEEDAEEKANNISTTRIIASTRYDPNSGWEIAMRISQRHCHNNKNAKGLVDRRGHYSLPSPSSAVLNQQPPPVLGRLLLRHCLRTTPVLKTTQPQTKARSLLYHRPPPEKLDRSPHSSKLRRNHPSSRRHNPRIPTSQ